MIASTKSCTADSADMPAMRLVQPTTLAPVNHVTTLKSASAAAAIAAAVPASPARASGFTEKPVIASTAKTIIFRRGYLVVPANRASRS